ncbi:MAG: sulfotransferase [Gammaproteobacteria bacterium]|nr:sulfotransferase [Gammaproteobacteria bacterium]
MNRIFIMSSERSGSNLIRSVLGAHKDIIAPTAIHFTTNLANKSAFYGDLNVEQNFRHLLEDMIGLSKTHFHPWEYKIEIEEVISACEQRTFWSAMIALYDHIALINGKQGWVCKDNALFDYISEILYVTKHQAKVIYLVRDGRDVSLSFLATPSGPKTITSSARLWLKEQLACLRVSQLYLDNIIMIKYEDFISDSERQCKYICNFLNIHFYQEMLNFHRKSETKSQSETSKFWENLSKPINNENSLKWVKKMTKTDALYYQNIVGTVFCKLGYHRIELPCSKYIFKWKFIRDFLLEKLWRFKLRFVNNEIKLRKAKAICLKNIQSNLFEENCNK